jgi:hypothetical protein
MDEKSIEFQYRDRDLSHIEARLRDFDDFEERSYAITASIRSDSFYGNVVFKFDSRILDFFPDLKEVRRDSIFELCSLLTKWLILTGQYRNFETIEGAKYPRLKLRSVESQGEADYVYKDEQRKVALVHPFVQRFDVEEHQLTRLALVESLYRVVGLTESDLYRRASMPKSLIDAELLGLVESGYILGISKKAATTGVSNSREYSVTLRGRNFYEQTVQNRSGIVFIIAACESDDWPDQKNVLETYKTAIRSTGFEPKFQEHEEPNKNIYVDIFDYIDSCEFVIADITYQRPSCYIEIGYALAKQKKVLMFVEEDYFNNTMKGKVPFDLFATKYQTYKYTNLTDLENKCDERIKNVQSKRLT